MEGRRRLLRMIGAAGVAGTAGCLGRVTDVLSGDSEWSPEIQGDEPELSPGSETSLTINAGPIQTLKVNPEGETGIHGDHQHPDGPVELDYFETTIDPSASFQLDSIPSVWGWGSQTEAQVELGAYVSDDAPPGEYPYSVEITEGGEVPESGESEAAEFVMTVTQD